MHTVTIILVCICIVGAVALPLGNPRFIHISLALEISFIVLTILTSRGIRVYTLLACIAVASLVIAGNTLSPVHTSIMSTLNPMHHAIILIVGGYILQSMLIASSVHTLYTNRRGRVVHEQR